jgi:hypothetical protein
MEPKMPIFRQIPKVIFLSILSACGGTMQGVIRETGQPVQFSYSQGAMSDTLTTVIDGETFTGRAVMRGGSTTIGNAFGSASSGGRTAFGTSTFVASTYTGNVVAMLLGSRGSTLWSV